MTRQQIAIRALAGLAAVSVCFYLVDYAFLRILMLHPTPSSPFESMTRTRILAIPQKNGKLDYQIDQLQPVETLNCVHTLFPHSGSPPCWYLKPRINRPIPVQ